MRNRKYDDVKPILKIIQSLQENFNYQINHVFIIKPDNFWQKQKTSFASSKYSFEHSLISMEQLSKYFDPNQLTPDLDGTLSFNNDQWIDFRIKLENFLIHSNDLLSRFGSLQIELSTFDQPDTKEACQEAIIAHTNTKQRVLGINIDQLINDGKNLLRNLIGNDDSLLMAPGGTRDSGYSGSESEKFSNDFFNEAHKIKEPMELLKVSKQKVHALWQQKKLKLEQCLQLRVFEQDCSQMMEWLNYNNKVVLMNYTDIGHSYSSAYDLLQKHEQFHKNCFSGAASIQHINSVANKLLASSHYASNLISLKTAKLEKEWQVFHSALQNRQKILSASCMFHNKADQYLNKVEEWKNLCSNNQISNSVQEAENALKKHHELSDEISQIYAEICNASSSIQFIFVCNDGKAILDSIQSSQSTQIGQMEFKQAASHILDIVYEILSNHRQLELLWVNKKQNKNISKLIFQITHLNII
ncbi:triple functional domain [Brachionus plicatilis]|uniref:Triple functional domain n=1 Tax=Brachionus plicatilis TaxID=10195 RepID=A0A3M7P5Y0_BRAPC|nr:triple functional domain [Brachionus plicatilis]